MLVSRMIYMTRVACVRAYACAYIAIAYANGDGKNVGEDRGALMQATGRSGTRRFVRREAQ